MEGFRQASLGTAQSAAIVCNNIGVSLYEDSKYELAFNNFREGLRFLAVGGVRILTDHNEFGSTVLGTTTPLKSSSNYEQGDGCAREIYKKKRFDEGMHTFGSAMSIDFDDPMNISVELNYAFLLYNMAQCQVKIDNDDEASKLYLKVQLILEEHKGISHHPLRTISIHKIGQLQYFRGELSNAVNTFIRAYRVAKKTLGDSRFDVIAATLNSLGLLYYQDSGNGQEMAMDLFQQALKLRVYVFGNEHKDVATTLNNIGRIYMQQADFESALSTFEQVLSIREEVLGKNHVDIAAAVFNVGQAYHKSGELQCAIDYYTDYLNMTVKKVGIEHLDVAEVLSIMGQVYQDKMNFEKAMKCYRKSLRISVSNLGEFHQENATTLNKIGNCYCEQGNQNGAILAYEKELKIELAVLKPAHPNVIVTLRNIGELHKKRGDYNGAIEKYHQLANIKIMQLGDSAPFISPLILNKIGFIQRHNGGISEYLDLADYLSKSGKDVRESYLGVAKSFNDIAVAHFKKGTAEVAFEYFKESLMIRKAIMGHEDYDLAFTLYNIALIQKKKKDYLKALESCWEALRVGKAVLGKDHPFLSMTFVAIGDIFQQQGNLRDALENFQEALRIGINAFGNNHVLIANMLREIGNVHLRLGHTFEMMKAFTEASRIYRRIGLSTENIKVAEQNLDILAISYPESAAAA
mmetsp:Transcript_37605/g.55394  ORF Transcript_37605/g.55394 Transcript_37605/m.55394 type:complete len:691 (+) Transcript_37605:145-2217(+)